MEDFLGSSAPQETQTSPLRSRPPSDAGDDREAEVLSIQTVRSAEYTINTDPSITGNSLGIDVDEPTLIIKTVDTYAVAWKAMELESERTRTFEPVEVGDQILEVNGMTALDRGRPQLVAALMANTSQRRMEIKVRRRDERRRIQLEAEPDPETDDVEEDDVEEDGVVILKEGEHKDGSSEQRWAGKVLNLASPNLLGCGMIRCGEQVVKTLGFDELPAPSYILDNGSFEVDDWVGFVVHFTKDGRPRASEIENLAKRNLAKRRRPEGPTIEATRPLPEGVSWSQALRRPDDPATSPPGRGPAFLATTSQRDYDELSDPASDDSSSSITGRFRNQLSLGAGPTSRPRYLHARDKALALKAPWRPAEWTEKQWEDQLRKAGELAPDVSPRQVRQVQVATGRPDVATVSLEIPMLGVQELLDQEADVGRQAAGVHEHAAGIIPARAIAARDTQTERVGTRLREENVAPSGMLADLMSGLEKERILQRVRQHQQRSADIFEAKMLLDSLNADLQDRRERPTTGGRRRSPRGHSNAGGGWIPNVGVQMNGPLYALGPPPLLAPSVPRSPDVGSNSELNLLNKAWL